MCRINLCLMTAAVFLTSGLATAANKSDKADRVVDAVLQRESSRPITLRADDLQGALDESDRARWAAGYVHTSNGWQRHDAATSTDDRIREYETRRGRETLTTEQHLELANWCRDQEMRSQERAHLWGIIATNPNASPIWQRLGFENKLGEWMTAEDQRQLAVVQKRREHDFKAWSPRILALQKRLTSVNPDVQSIARDELYEIKDAKALPAIEATFSMMSQTLATEVVNWCKRNESVDTTLTLARQSVVSHWEPVRTLAADALRSRRMDHYAPVILQMMATEIDLNVYTQTPRSRREVVFVYQSQRETLSSIQRSTYALKSIGIGAATAQPNPVLPLPNNFDRRARQVGNQLLDARNLLDLQRAIADELQQRSNQTASVNAEQSSINTHAAQSLSIATASTSKASPEEWWRWWHQEMSTDIDAPKKLLEVSEFDEYRPAQTAIENSHSCLPAGTGVMTGTGLRPIESILIGDTVLAKDIETGELSYKPVIRTTVRSPQPLTTLHTKADSIRATLGHYFWVSGQGWRMAKEIKPGDRLHGVQGTVTVTDVSPGGNEAVYNLVVEGANSYFVGESCILSHDVTSPVPTDIIVPGLVAR